MEPSAYEMMYQVEDKHWWYAGMRHITRAMLDRHVGAGLGAILDGGCGTGANLVLLDRYGAATDLDMAPMASALGAAGPLPGAQAVGESHARATGCRGH